MKNRQFLLWALLCCLWLPFSAKAQEFRQAPVETAESSEASSESEVDVNELVFGHIGDAYSWPITESIQIPLPCIVKGDDGWRIFMSSRLREGQSYDGFYLAKEGDLEGKIVMRTSDGAEVRPVDISITKDVLGLMINSAILVALVLYCSRWYRRNKVEHGAPKGLVGMVEVVILMIYEDVIKEGIGEDYKRFTPYLLTAFFFILVNNLMGLIPIFPGGVNITGNIAITLVLALCTFLLTNIFGTKEYWKEVFWPDVPWWMKVPVPLMPVIEFFGLFTKPFALMIRLFANIMAGHAAILSLIAIIFITVKVGPVINGSMTFMAVFFSIFMSFLEILVAFIQAYVFTMLSAVFIGLARVKHSK